MYWPSSTPPYLYADLFHFAHAAFAIALRAFILDDLAFTPAGRAFGYCLHLPEKALPHLTHLPGSTAL
jgi:hypothetical protein